MRKPQKKMSRLLVLCFLLMSSVVSAQAPENYPIALWTFDGIDRFKEGNEVEADFNRQVESAVLRMSGGDLQRDSAGGTSYTDYCGTKYESTRSLKWDDVRGEDENISEDDAQLEVQVSTTDWENIAFRFYYISEQAESFDLSYHLGDGDWKLVADNVVIDSGEDWHYIEVGLQEEDDIENRSTVVFLVHDLTKDFGRREFRIDNVVVLGERISTPLTCPPILTPIDPLENISFSLNSEPVPTFTGDNGFQFRVTDEDSAFDDLTILALTNNPNVVNQLGLAPIDKEKGIFQLDIGEPYGYTGVATVKVRVIDGSGSVAEQDIRYEVTQ